MFNAAAAKHVEVLIGYNNYSYYATLTMMLCFYHDTHHAVYTTTKHMVLNTEYLEVNCTLNSSSSFTGFEVTYLQAIAFLTVSSSIDIYQMVSTSTFIY